ncbi:hypothetical protein ACS0TY_017318 [Phlomoides rotata]
MKARWVPPPSSSSSSSCENLRFRLPIGVGGERSSPPKLKNSWIVFKISRSERSDGKKIKREGGAFF